MKQNRIDLIWLSNSQRPSWELGSVRAIKPELEPLCHLISEYLKISKAEAWLFWDGDLGAPDEKVVLEVLSRPGDVWHAGLNLGLNGLPRLLDYVAPTWMLNCDPPAEKEVTSWRLSLRACLIRTEVLRELGCIHPGFQTLTGAGLEMGHRYLMQGALTRHIPWLVPAGIDVFPPQIPLEDELFFIALRYKRIWLKWCLTRSLLAFRLSPLKAKKIWYFYINELKSYKEKRFSKYLDITDHQSNLMANSSVSVILPTRKRYHYIQRCLATLSEQSVPPMEIICVDQTPAGERRPEIYNNFANKGVRVIWQDGIGQSLARNTAILVAQGNWLFFADDDSEYPPDTIAQHLHLLMRTLADVSTGLTLPPFAYTIPPDFRNIRVAYNLATGNALVRKRAIWRVGGFDRNYDFGKGADTDLGMRLYLDGCLIIHNPYAHSIHHKAESGGLRDFGVLWETYSKGFLKPRPVTTHTYWIMRYFHKKKWSEAILYNVFIRGLSRISSTPNREKKLLLCLREIFGLPITFFQIYQSLRKAKILLNRGPRFLGINE